MSASVSLTGRLVVNDQDRDRSCGFAIDRLVSTARFRLCRGQVDREHRASTRLRTHADGAVMTLNDAVADRKAKSGAVGALGREKRLEDFCCTSSGIPAPLSANRSWSRLLLRTQLKTAGRRVALHQRRLRSS